MATIEKEHGVFRLPDVYDASHRGNGNTNGTMASFGRYGNDAAMETSMALKNYGEKQQFPAIIVRDIAGRPLDTNTSYQRAIYEAKWKVSINYIYYYCSVTSPYMRCLHWSIGSTA